jgi:predicted pyridoxine 5'-phosphate oxidase superfamily flavin-nucleotide-binding protein
MDTTSPFHADEIKAQGRAGVRANPASIRPFMPDQHRQFFALLRYVFVSVPDEQGWPVATVLTGPPGFVHAPTPTELRIDAPRSPSDPASPGYVPLGEIGILGLDLETRRRNRANGRIAGVDDDGLRVELSQSFGNCAQYIQTRTIRPRVPQRLSGTHAISGIDENGRRLIAASDTFFVASRSRADLERDGGLDISHRGGRPGFVRVEGDTLLIPDFRGNRFFNTFGNFVGDDRAGLLFIDFESGGLLQVAGRVTIDWDADSTAKGPSGAQRLWRVEIARSWWRPDALPFTWAFGEYAPTTLATGVW